MLHHFDHKNLRVTCPIMQYYIYMYFYRFYVNCKCNERESKMMSWVFCCSAHGQETLWHGVLRNCCTHTTSLLCIIVGIAILWSMIFILSPTAPPPLNSMSVVLNCSAEKMRRATFRWTVILIALCMIIHVHTCWALHVNYFMCIIINPTMCMKRKKIEEEINSTPQPPLFMERVTPPVITLDLSIIMSQYASKLISEH